VLLLGIADRIADAAGHGLADVLSDVIADRIVQGKDSETPERGQPLLFPVAAGHASDYSERQQLTSRQATDLDQLLTVISRVDEGYRFGTV
jgi:hypothetical protein